MRARGTSVGAAPARLPAGGMIRFYEAVNREGAVPGGRLAIKRRHGRTDALTRTFINSVSRGVRL